MKTVYVPRARPGLQSTFRILSPRLLSYSQTLNFVAEPAPTPQLPDLERAFLVKNYQDSVRHLPHSHRCICGADRGASLDPWANRPYCFTAERALAEDSTLGGLGRREGAPTSLYLQARLPLRNMNC